MPPCPSTTIQTLLRATANARRLRAALDRYREAEVELLIALRATFPHGTPMPQAHALDAASGHAEVWSSITPLCLSDVLHNVHLRVGSSSGGVMGVPLSDLLGLIASTEARER